MLLQRWCTSSFSTLKSWQHFSQNYKMKLVRVNFSIFPFWSKCVKLTKKVGKRPSIVELELGQPVSNGIFISQSFVWRSRSDWICFIFSGKGYVVLSFCLVWSTLWFQLLKQYLSVRLYELARVAGPSSDVWPFENMIIMKEKEFVNDRIILVLWSSFIVFLQGMAGRVHKDT